jgi:predicted HTH domain antitoxin
MSTLAVEIPDDVAASLRLPPDARESELRKELALALYQRRILPLGKARALAGLTRWEFEELLGQRQIPRDYDEASLAEDLSHARGGK